MTRTLTALSLCFCLLLCLLLPGCAPAAERYSYTYLDVFDTVTALILYAPTKQQADDWAEKLHTRLTELHRLYTIYDTYDGVVNLAAVNQAAGEPVTVDERIISLLTLGQEMYAVSGGKVNILMGSVLSLWHQARTAAGKGASATLPDRTALQTAAKHTDIQTMRLDAEKNTVHLTDPESTLDVGAVAKGYAVEEVAAYAKELGITSALISVGGNVVAVGDKPDDTPFVIGIEDPRSQEDYALTVRVDDLAVVTSGNYQRYYEVDGVRYHHLIDPDTLFPADFTASVTVIGPDSGRADALSTALFLMPPEEGLSLLDTQDGYEAVWIRKDGSHLFSKNFEQYTHS